MAGDLIRGFRHDQTEDHCSVVRSAIVIQTEAPTHMDPATRRENSWVYYNGEYKQFKDARVGLLTHALNYGTGCFEGIRAYWNESEEQLYAVRMPEHYVRMVGNAKTLQIMLPHSVDELCAITLDVLRRNHPREDMYIRPLAFKSDEIIG